MSYEVIGVPSSAGAYGMGQEEAPRALRAAGLLDRLGEATIDSGDLELERFRPDPTNRKAQNIERVLKIIGEVRKRTSDAIRRGLTPLVLGGDCTITLGVVAGVADCHETYRLAYFDGDADLATPETTRSGVLDAMGIAHLLDLDGAEPRLAGAGPDRPLISASQLALIGYEEDDLNDDERRLLDDLGVRRFSAGRLRDDPAGVAGEAVGALGDQPRIVHFDVDAVDSVDLPLAEFPHFNTGVSLDAATKILEVLCSAPGLAAVVVTEVCPRRDPEGHQIQRLVDALGDALAGAA